MKWISKGRERCWGIALWLTAVAVAWIAIAHSSLFGAGLATILSFFGGLLLFAGKGSFDDHPDDH